jgi:hypothetical protein
LMEEVAELAGTFSDVLGWKIKIKMLTYTSENH